VDWRMQLDAACSAENLAWVSDRAKANQRPYVEKLSSYCDGYVPSQDLSGPDNQEAVTDTLLRLDRAQSRDRFANRLEDASVSETNGIVVDWLRSASIPQQLLGAGDYLSEYYRSTGDPLWRPEIGNVNVGESAITDLQIGALELYSCRRFGGC